MKQFLPFILCIFIVASCSNPEQATSKADAIANDSSKYTTIQWLDTAVNFGSKKMGEVVNITFRCTNTGDKPLYLLEVRPSCGCTLADYTKEPIAPGKEGKIEAQFDTRKSHPGEVHKTVFVRANNSNEVSSYLQFSGTVLPSDSAQTAKQ